jgi:hypothetical protein
MRAASVVSATMAGSSLTHCRTNNENNDSSTILLLAFEMKKIILQILTYSRVIKAVQVIERMI